MIIYCLAGVPKEHRAETLKSALDRYCEKKGLSYNPDKKGQNIYSFSCGEHGKPYLPKKALMKDMRGDCGGQDANRTAEIHFSVSHSGRYWIVGIHDTPLGIDIEDMQYRSKSRDDLFKIARRFFSPAEIAYADTSSRFYEVWTRKEAYVKYTGMGLGQGLGTFSTVKNDNQLVSKVKNEYLDGGFILQGKNGLLLLPRGGTALEEANAKRAPQAVISWCTAKKIKWECTSSEREAKITWQKQEHMQQVLLFQEL